MGKLGQNRGYVDELYASYRADPASVSEAWREFFSDYEAEPVEGPTEGRPRVRSATPPGSRRAEPLKGAAARIAQNMAASLGVPTATSSRTIPVKMLEEHRRIINQHQSTIAGPKISFTHLIAWAIVRALDHHPEMTTRYAEIDGEPHRIPGGELRLGLAVDVDRAGERLLLVPNVKGADKLDFPSFVAAYDDLVARSRRNELTVADFEETTITLTNPGMLGTVLSVPRLMEGQSAIVGVGAIGYPAEYAGMSAEVTTELGLSKVMTVTSTYDHRVIQGAASGAFLATLDSLLQGGDGLYKRIFLELGVPHEPIAWQGDRNPQILASGSGNTEVIAKQAGVLQLIRSYRVRGHLWADLDPLGYGPEPNPELELSHYGLTVWDLDRRFIAGGLAGHHGTLKLREIMETCEQTYCRHIGVEYMHIQDTGCRHWLQERMEQTRIETALSRDDKLHILRRLNAAEAFEAFLGTNYVGQKRFSLEGAETLIPMLDFLFTDAAAAGMEEVVMGMAHRGRLNVLANIVGKSYGQIFREFEGDIDPATPHGSGDVKYHLGCTGTFRSPGGEEIRVRVASNPSHLEAVDPVVEGKVRALQDLRSDTARERVLPVLIHGDAAFSGQGVVAETLNLSDLKGYRTGGTVHVVVNNQIGFTTGPAEARSSHYSTDVAKMLRAPIFHVNGDHPEDAVRVIRLALTFRQEFKRDVVVDLVCYRRWGHNEADDPSYTHPILYAKIEKHRSVRKLYTERLMRGGELDVETAERALQDFGRRLQEVHDEVQRAQDDGGDARDEVEPDLDEVAPEPWRHPATGVDREVQEKILRRLGEMPEGFRPHPKLDKQLARRAQRFEQGRIDWALAEALCFGSLLLEGTPVRLSGEDSARGTFSQRHAALYDYQTSEPHVPLACLAPGQAPFHAVDSLLSEFAVLGFEYGYSVGHPDALVLWEAQFGDFVNGAQVILDQFVVSAERKWGQQCGLVLLLPHGQEGQGPEHSSAHLERFLQLAARGNLRIAHPNTPAQYFHLLRAQARTSERKPLIVMTPKSLLRHKACVSTAEQLAAGVFEPVLDDARAGAGAASLLLCAGKVYYDLEAERESRGIDDVAICRVEQLYPFPAEALGRILDRHGGPCRVDWVQEEPRNMGAWNFVRERVESMLGGRSLGYIGRPADASPATGSHRRHVAEQSALVRRALTAKRADEAGTPTR